jgi:hypothetical protein
MRAGLKKGREHVERKVMQVDAGVSREQCKTSSILVEALHQSYEIQPHPKQKLCL